MDGVVNEQQTSVWTIENLSKYLSIYYSDQVEWEEQLKRLSRQVSDSSRRRKQAAYTILAPYLHKTAKTTPIESLLFVCNKWADYDDLDWVDKLEETYYEDIATEALRAELLALGYIHPIEHDPRCRQALKWLCEQAGKQDEIALSPPQTKSSITNKYKGLIYTYGPSSVCALFQKPELKQQLLNNVHNWKTAYFVEKELRKHNTPKQLIERKSIDLNRTNKELIAN